MLFFKKLRGPISLLFMIMIINSSTSLGANLGQDVSYTTPPVAYIRESPGYDSPNVATVYRGEQVKVLSRGAAGWCQVKTVQSQQVGWIQYDPLGDAFVGMHANLVVSRRQSSRHPSRSCLLFRIRVERRREDRSQNR